MSAWQRIDDSAGIPSGRSSGTRGAGIWSSGVQGSTVRTPGASSPAGLSRIPDEQDGQHATAVTPAGAGWLASASRYPRSALSLWESRPTAPTVLDCGSVFDVVNVPAIFGRRMLDTLWSEGPGSGPVAGHRGRMLLFAAPGTAQRLPSLLHWEEWGDAVPPLLCHGTGDAVTVPSCGLLRSPVGPALAGGPRHPTPLAPGPRGHALGLCPGGACGGGPGGEGGRLIDFSPRRSGC